MFEKTIYMCILNRFFLLLFALFLTGGAVAVSEGSECIRPIHKPMEFQFIGNDLEAAKGQYFDVIHILNRIGSDEIMVGSKTFHLAHELETTGLCEGMFVGIRLNSKMDTVVSIEKVERPSWWGDR